MELKQTKIHKMALRDKPFNRTRMELKHGNDSGARNIEHSFNRTRMELKLQDMHLKALDPLLLIVPEWN